MSAPSSSDPVRGPDGSVDLPPLWLAKSQPLETFGSGTAFNRVHRTAHHPVFFGPGANRAPTYRFDSAASEFGVLYIAPGLDAAVVETLLRSPQQRMMSLVEIEKRSVSLVGADRDLRLVAAHGQYLSQIGATAALFTGPYGPCRIWSDALYLHPDEPDGILYPSRHNPEELCVALFERADISMSVTSTKALMEMMPTVAKILDRHGKSLSA